MTFRVEYNIQTGERVEIPLTSEEIAEREAQAAAAAAAEAAKVPPEISDVQFALEWAARGVITRAEALDFVRVGTIPTAFQAALDAIPDADAKFAAEMRVSGSTVYRRSHPDTIALSAAFGLDAAQTDQFFRDAAQR